MKDKGTMKELKGKVQNAPNADYKAVRERLVAKVGEAQVAWFEELARFQSDCAMKVLDSRLYGDKPFVDADGIKHVPTWYVNVHKIKESGLFVCVGKYADKASANRMVDALCNGGALTADCVEVTHNCLTVAIETKLPRMSHKYLKDIRDMNRARKAAFEAVKAK